MKELSSHGVNFTKEQKLQVKCSARKEGKYWVRDSDGWDIYHWSEISQQFIIDSYNELTESGILEVDEAQITRQKIISEIDMTRSNKKVKTLVVKVLS